jgi:hypothetical protein
MKDKLHENGHAGTSKMKVHPVMLMKTNGSRCQVSGARCQGRGSDIGCQPLDERL